MDKPVSTLIPVIFTRWTDCDGTRKITISFRDGSEIATIINEGTTNEDVTNK